MNDRPSLLKNTGTRQNAVAIRLTGTKSNRSAIGARCMIEAGGHKQIADVISGGSYYSQSSLTLYFGLGKTDKIDRIEVRWPSGQKQTWSSLGANRLLDLTEGAEAVRERAFTR